MGRLASRQMYRTTQLLTTINFTLIHAPRNGRLVRQNPFINYNFLPWFSSRLENNWVALISHMRALCLEQQFSNFGVSRDSISCSSSRRRRDAKEMSSFFFISLSLAYFPVFPIFFSSILFFFCSFDVHCDNNCAVGLPQRVFAFVFCW